MSGALIPYWPRPRVPIGSPPLTPAQQDLSDQFSITNPGEENPLLSYQQSQSITQVQPTAGPIANPAVNNSTNPAWVRKGRRAVGAIFPDVTIEESHTDRLQVTQHPVAEGSPVNDHAFRLPAALTMRCGWAGTSDTRPREVYDTLRKLQGTQAGEPVQLIDITTGKRDYKNMVLAEITIRTEQATENVLIADLHFQEIILVQIKSTSQPAVKDMGLPASTQDTVDTGAKQAKPQEEKSVLLGTAQGLGTGAVGTLGPQPAPGLPANRLPVEPPMDI